MVDVTRRVDGGVVDRHTTERYTAGDRTVERRVERTDDGTEIRHREGREPYGESDVRPVNATAAHSLGGLALAVVERSTWAQTGSGRLEGVVVTRYDAEDEQFAVPAAPDADGRATLVVDENGVVRYVAYRFVVETDGERTEYVYRAGYAEVGSTTVEEPAWADEASPPERFANDGVLIAGRA